MNHKASRKYSLLQVTIIMTTIKLAILRHTRAKDGTYKIRLSIGHKSETSYIVTKYRVTSFGNFKNGVVVGQHDAAIINVKLRKLLNQYDERLERIPNPNDYTSTQLRDLLENMKDATSNTTLQTVTNLYTQQLRNEGRTSYADIINKHVARFLDFTHGDIFLSELTPRLVDDYVHSIRSTGASLGYEHIRIVNVRTIVNYAIKMQMVCYDINPFAYWQSHKSEPREIDISIEDTRILFSHNSKYRGIRKALDMFKLSYYLGGMNLMDMLAYDFRDCDKKPLSYIRQKTRNKKTGNKTTTFNIVPEAYPIIRKYMDKKTGHLSLHQSGSYVSILNGIDRSLRTVTRQLSLSCQDYISFYSARKSFVQHGFELGIPLEVLEYCIGQSVKSNRPIFNYVKIMSKHANEAIRKIVDNIKTAPPVTGEAVSRL